MNILQKIKRKTLSYIINPVKRRQNRKLINEKFSSSKDGELIYLFEKNEEETWKNSFMKLFETNPHTHEILNSFTQNHIQLLKKPLRDEFSPILISVVKNENDRIQTFINHYRKIGVKHFAILDNNSSDGTREWLCQQKDCDVFYTEEQYSTHKREAWINRLLSYYGFNKWYLVVDSDEHFVYPECESKNITDLISYLNNNKYKRVRSLMLDMYPKESIVSQNTHFKDLHRFNYTSIYSYFDKDTYEVFKEDVGIMIKGGPRKRIFNLDVYLTKHPLFLFEEGDIQGHSHYQNPYIKNEDLPCFSVLMHYKFLNTDLNKYEQRVKEGSFYNGSEEYKRYLNLFKNENELSFYYEGSRKYNNSKSLLDIELISDIKF